MAEQDFTVPVRVTAHGCKTADEAASVWHSFLTEVDRIVQRHELTVETVGVWRGV